MEVQRREDKTKGDEIYIAVSHQEENANGQWPDEMFKFGIIRYIIKISMNRNTKTVLHSGYQKLTSNNTEY